MLGGYNISPLIDLLDDAEVGAVAAEGLKKTLLMFDQFHDVKEKADKGNANAKAVLQSWADAEWFTSRPEVPQEHHRHRVQGDRRNQHRRPVARARRLEPPRHPAARPGDAQERAPRHHARRRRQARPDASSSRTCKRKGHLVAYVGDVVGTGSSRKSATNSRALVHRRRHPLRAEQALRRRHAWAARSRRSSTTRMEDSGALPIELDVSQMDMGDVVELRPYEGKALKDGKVIAEFTAQERRAVRRGARRRPHSADHRPLASPPRRARRWACRPPRCSACRKRPVDTKQGLHAGAEDGRPRLRPARRPGRAPRHLLRAAHDHGRLARTPPAR